jgi:hypothetical protein
MNLAEVTKALSVGWHTVFESIKMAEDWYLKHRDLTNIKGIGTDKIAWQKGHKGRGTVRHPFYPTMFKTSFFSKPSCGRTEVSRHNLVS